MGRAGAYLLMQELMDLPPEKAHIAMFDEDQCRLLISKIKEYRGLQ